MDWEQDGGYDCELIEEPPDELTCPICLLPPKRPHLITCCGRKLCHSCIYRVQKAGNPCPCCKDEKYDIVLDRMVERQVLDLKVYCKYKSKGCSWTGELRDLEGHLKLCFETALNRNKELLLVIQKMQELLSNKNEEMEGTIKTLKEENQQLKEELHQLNKQLPRHTTRSKAQESKANELLEKELEELKFIHDKKIDDKNGKINRLNDEIESLNKKIFSQEKEIKETHVKVSNEERALRRTNERLTEENRKLKQQSAQWPYQYTTTDPDREIEELRCKHDRRIAEKNEKINSQDEEIKCQQEEIFLLKRQIREFEEKVMKLTQDGEAKTRNIEKLNKENKKLESELKQQATQSTTKESTPSDTHTYTYSPSSPGDITEVPSASNYEETRQCPMCHKAFSVATSQRNFELHVNTHFH